MGKRGPQQKERCVNDHVLNEDTVVVVRRGKYKERQCLICRRERSRRWWRENRGKNG